MIIKLLFLVACQTRRTTKVSRSLGICPLMPDCYTQKEILVCVYPYNHHAIKNLNKNRTIRFARCSVSAIFPPALLEVRNMISHNALISGYPEG